MATSLSQASLALVPANGTAVAASIAPSTIIPKETPVKKKRGRQPGSSAFKTAHLEAMVEIVRTLLPRSPKHWEDVEAVYNRRARANGWKERSASSLLTKFRKIRDTTKPTGDPSMPDHVRNAIRAQREIELKVQAEGCGDSSDEEDDDIDIDIADDDDDDEEEDIADKENAAGADDNPQADAIEDRGDSKAAKKRRAREDHRNNRTKIEAKTITGRQTVTKSLDNLAASFSQQRESSGGGQGGIAMMLMMQMMQQQQQQQLRYERKQKKLKKKARKARKRLRQALQASPGAAHRAASSSSSSSSSSSTE
mmetsp:Transcript_23514/g.56055  ORF Transcript_23514/g.56055 Transcript_23514/m.56055 type:complete len:310 (+) Transcript_23514:10-939(+)